MLPDSFEVSTSPYDLFIPPALSITRPDALLSSPTIQEYVCVSVGIAQASRTKRRCFFRMLEELHHGPPHVRIPHGCVVD
jgi:hypothetical protein